MPNFKMPSVSLKSRLNRRNFFKFTLGAVLSSYASKSTFAVIDDMPFEERSLSLFNPRTKEDFDGIYWRNGDYVAAALENVNHLMRDIRTGDVKQIDTDLLDLIYKISLKLETEKPFHILSGYRSPKTNSMLLKHYENVAMNSYHLTGRAVDIRLPGLRISGLRRVAYELKEGGIGYYPRQRFVHIDVGPVRYWYG